MNRRSRSITRRSSILKIDVNREDDTGIVGGRNRRSSRRVSFAEMCQIKEFQRDSPKVFKELYTDDNHDGNQTESSAESKNQGITGLDKLLTGAIQTPYQDVAEYPIPEMSSESFNIFDINKTVLDSVDMDTTQVGGSVETFLPQMDFQSEPSMELRFDTTSFLQSLQAKPSDSLKTMQIYSPKRDRYLEEQSSPNGQSLPLHFNNMDHDKENMIPMEALQSFSYRDQEPEALKYLRNNEEAAEPKVDSKMFLQSLFGGGPKKSEETQLDVEEMEETACINDLVEKVNMDRTSGGFTVSQNTDLTRYFNSEDVTVGIEETKCVGGIVNEVMSVGNAVEADKENRIQLANQTVHMEETKPIGGILKGVGLNTSMQAGLRMQKGYVSDINAEDNVTRCFKMEEGEDDGVEETKCVGGILSNANEIENSMNGSPIGSTQIANFSEVPDAMSKNQAVNRERKGLSPMEVSVPDDVKSKSFKSENTVNFNITNMQDNMEETRPIGGIIDRTEQLHENEHVRGSHNKSTVDSGHQTVVMEETVALGKICTSNDESLNQLVNKSVAEPECLIDSNTVMEETKPIGGIFKNAQQFNKNSKQSWQHEENMEVTKNITVPMEETRAIGGLLDRSKVETISDKTVNVSVAMEETKALGGLLDKSISKNFEKISGDNVIDKTTDYTVAMEETKAVGRILEKVNSDQISYDRKDSSASNKTLNQTVPVEETKTVGGILNKTLDQTIYFDNIKPDWVSKDLKSDSGKAADGTSVEMLNKTASIEETKCVGGILTSDMEMMKGKFENLYNHANDKVSGDKTVVESVPMEETKCITDVVDNKINQSNVDADFKGAQSSSVVSDAGFPKNGYCTEDEIDMKSMETEGKSRTSTVNVESNTNDIEIDDEITFKVSSKRNFDECRDVTSDKNEEKTKDFTQSQTNLAKLKEMLILSKRKSAAHYRQGDIRTPSKFSPLFPGSASESTSKTSCSGKLDLGVARSPLHKRQRLSEADLGDNTEVDDVFGGNEKTDATAALLMGFEDDGFTTGLLEMGKLDSTDLQGIDDEQMPDTMHHDLGASNSTNDTHSDKNSTMQSELASTTVQECNETHSSGNDTRNSVNMSMFSNKSFALPFVVPEGPLSLESFFRLTFTLSSKIQGARCSTIFAPRIDLDDLTEVLHADLTLKPMVKAKKKMKEYFTQQIEKSEEGMEWLEKSLEETQPEIFQECSTASSEELEKIIGQLRSLLLACHKEAEVAWKQGTMDMFSEALHEIQNDGVKKAEEMLHKVKEDSQTLDDLLSSLDEDLETLDKNDQMLDDLQEKQGKLNRENDKLSALLQEKSAEESVLRAQVETQSQKDSTEEMKVLLRQEIVSHLICSEWNLDELEEDFAVFTFLEDKVELGVHFLLGAKEKQISDITLRSTSTTDCRYFKDRVALAFTLHGINTDSLKQKFTTFSSLPKLLHEVSVSINEIRMFCKDLDDLLLQHVIKFENNSILFELWDRNTMNFIKASLVFNPSHPLTEQVEPSVTVRIGNLKSSFIEEKLQEVTPGPRYLSRLIQSVNFQQFKKDITFES